MKNFLTFLTCLGMQLSSDCGAEEQHRSSQARFLANLRPTILISYLKGAFHKRSRLV